MPGIMNDAHRKIMSQIIDYIKSSKKYIHDEVFLDFVKCYYSHVSYEDLHEKPIGDLAAIAKSHWKMIQKRKPQEALIKIFNPVKEKDGWTTPHTVIQISHDDIPFLVDSTRMTINRFGYEIHFINHFGGMKVMRDASNKITEILVQKIENKAISSEAPIYIEVDNIDNEAVINKLIESIHTTLMDVRLSVIDWRKMVERIETCLDELETKPPHVDALELTESRDFLRWLINNNFTFLGARDYKLIGNGTNRALQIIPGSGLGVLRDETFSTAAKMYAELPPQARKIALSKNILIIAKTNTTSTVHRKAYTDYVGIKMYNENSELIGERRFIGLYTSSAYHTNPKHIPFLRHKVDKVLELLNFPPDSHDGKEAVHILETLPRDDLFQASVEELLELTAAILHLKERKKIRLLVRRDAYYRYFSCLVFVPREVFKTDLAVLIQQILMEDLKGIECNFNTYFSDSNLARIHYHIRVNPKTPLVYHLPTIENKIVSLARSWFDELKDQLIIKFGEAEGLKYFNKYYKVLPASYYEDYSVTEAVLDIEKIENISKLKELDMLFSASSNSNVLNLKLFHSEKLVVLSDVLPIFENMGLRVIGERPHEIKFSNGVHIWIHDFSMIYAVNKIIDINEIKDIFQKAFTKIWYGLIENDGFNRLVLEANLSYKETNVLRAYTKYLRQIGFTFSQSYIERALINNYDLAKILINLFQLRFDPVHTMKEREDTTELINNIEQALDLVSSLDEDRIIRRLLELILATNRTNYYQKDKDGHSKSYLSIKFDPEKISDLPLPRPKYEIFVYSPYVEGIHLRAGKVARGGLRWSDRFEDFRTEVLGLMKAQQVKNTVIVPEGAKGGFVVKKVMLPETTREDYMKEVIDCYSTFISGLLDLTDNIVETKVVSPPNVIRYDDPDPYLVVAADKGTATFSDIANSIAQKYEFWLGDAFASGGSAGYDHKKMGITSRGVWVSVKRNFRELGLDPDKIDFTVIGIGDMAGDVFGNGMLLSKHIKLVAAFNHLHIFIDPNPDCLQSYEERKRLFSLPRSTWKDYNSELISTGGGVFDRTAKSIKLSPEIKQLLQIKKESLVPNELIKALLKAPVDLIWNGGIGTFIKASQESHLEVGDRTNDMIRVNANEVEAKTIAEGGNLGITQLARIEYSLLGGVINTDFIDNSAGVDCSDHEVNIKILMNQLLSEDIISLKQRNKLLEQMTDEVAELVLLDNYDQNLILSLETSVAQQTVDLYRQYINDLEKAGRLDRALEFLPNDQALAERKIEGKPLTRPEIAILIAYSKMYLKQDILASDLIDDDFFDKYLLTVFPKPLIKQFPNQINQHKLRREIIATQLTKSIIDRMGINFVERLQRETGASIPFVIKAFSIASNLFNLEKIWEKIKSLDYQVTQTVQFRMILQIYYLVRRATRWFLRNRKPSINIQKTISLFEPYVGILNEKLRELLDSEGRTAFDTAVEYLTEQKVPSALAEQIAACQSLFTIFDIIESAEKYNLDIFEVATTYYQLGTRLELNWLRDMMGAYNIDTQWDELARAGFRDDLDRVQRKLAARVLTTKIKDIKEKSISERIEIWIKRYQFLMDRWQKLIADIKASDNVDFVTYSVVLRELFEFAQAS